MTKSKKKKGLTYNFVCFGDLAYEFEPEDAAETEKKIKKRLKYYSLGNYDQERVDYIRKIRNDLYNEILKFQKSNYYKRSPAKKGFAHPDDFDFERLKNDYLKKYPKINNFDMASMINFAIYLFYLR